MNETQEKLITERGVIILPEDMGHEAYELVLECLLRAEDSWHDTIRLFCRGDGGCARSALAIVDLVREHGNVAGMLAGEAHSSHAIIWAGCPQRYVYPMGAIGLHRVAVNGLSSRQDAVSLKAFAEEYAATDRRMVKVLNEACPFHGPFWINLLEETGSGGVKMFSAADLISMEMAKPVSEYKSRLIESTLSQATPAKEADEAGLAPTEASEGDA